MYEAKRKCSDLTSVCVVSSWSFSSSPTFSFLYVYFTHNVQGFYFYSDNREEYIKFLEVKVLDVVYAIPLLINIDKKEKFGDFIGGPVVKIS